MRVVLVACLMLFSGCAAKRFIAGEIVHRVVSCSNPEVCKEEMARECPDGGVLHSLKPAIEVEYSCHDE